MTRSLFLGLGPLLAALAYALSASAGYSIDIAWTAAITVCCIVWWISEALPIPITSLLPLALFPMVGVLTKEQVAEAYGSSLILLLLGGFILSRAMEHSGAHKRLALYTIRLIGGKSARHIVWGFMLAAALLSMWISNMATVLMMLPIALAVMAQSDDQSIAVPLMLGIAYSASVGGMGTPIGTTPNLVFMEVYAETTGIEIGFVEWMTVALPVVCMMIPLIAWSITRKLPDGGSFTLPTIGDWSSHERRVLLVFGLTALAWVTRKEPFGGWSSWFGMPGANDASVAFIAVIAMFIIPSGMQKGERLLNWERASDIQWGILLLFAGGLCIAKGFTVSGLGAALANGLVFLQTVPVFVMLLLLCLFVTFLTETTSNTASAALLLPILAAAATATGIAPEVLMYPAVLTASCAFMLPVATAPNAIVFASGQVTTQRMAREGLILNLLGATLVASYFYLIN
ncbi:MAG: SLC13 family permease [Pseudomonadota bacterium]